MVIVTMVFFSAGWLYLTADYDLKYLNYIVTFTLHKPFVYRVIVPLVANGIMALLGAPAEWAMVIVVFASGLGAFWAIKRFFSLYVADILRLHLYSFLAFMAEVLLITNFRNYNDFTTVALFCLAFYHMASDKPLPYLVLFPLMVLHRETTILLTSIFILYFWGKMPARNLLAALAYQGVVYTALRFALSLIFSNTYGSQVNYLFYYDVMGVYLQTPAMLIPLVMLCGMLFVMYLNWGRYPRFLQVAFMLFPIQIALHLMLGYPFEFRVLAESLPLLSAIVASIHSPFIILRNTSKILGSKRIPSP